MQRADGHKSSLPHGMFFSARALLLWDKVDSVYSRSFGDEYPGAMIDQRTLWICRFGGWA